MTEDDDKLRDLQRVFPRACLQRDGVFTLVHIPDLPVQVGEETRHVDALLCPQEHGGYSTRLFLAEGITQRTTIGAKPANWSSHAFLGRNWHSWSWQGVVANQPLLAMLANHLAALR